MTIKRISPPLKILYMHAFLRLLLWNISENFSVVLPPFPTTLSQLKGQGTGNEKKLSVPRPLIAVQPTTAHLTTIFFFKKKTVNNTEAMNSEQQACREMWDGLRSKNH